MHNLEVMISEHPFAPPDPLRRAIREAYLADETSWTQALVEQAGLDAKTRGDIFAHTCAVVRALRETPGAQKGLDAFLQEYDLSSEEGVVLMCLAEALLRIPDAETADRLIREKLSTGHWDEHLGKSESILVNASTWGLMLTGRLINLAPDTRNDLGAALKRLAARSGEPVVRVAVTQAMEIIGRQFVLGETIEQALERSNHADRKRYLYSYDMLGEAAMTAPDAHRFFDAYAHAITAIGKHRCGSGVLAPGISIKLSALHPRYEYAQRDRVLKELTPPLLELARLAKQFELLVTIDAEEADRLELSLDVFRALYSDPALSDWEGLGMAVQAYQKRALPTLNWLVGLADRYRRQIPVRLVKGAYWDNEIKQAQIDGLGGYPVFTRKSHTDISYLSCSQRLLQSAPLLYPQFATHNAHTMCSVLALANGKDFEFQRLHGMGRGLYDLFLQQRDQLRCRIYAPVGGHAELLPYLVRRLLENGANTSFVNRIVHREVPVEAVAADPINIAGDNEYAPHPLIPLPVNLYGTSRVNSQGLNLSDPVELEQLKAAMEKADGQTWTTVPMVAGQTLGEPIHGVYSPADQSLQIGTVAWADTNHVDGAVSVADRGFWAWQATSPNERAAHLDNAADILEAQRAALMTLCVREAGKTLPDALTEVREAVDYCRYYASLARHQLQSPQSLIGPSGESNQLSLHGRGVFACISPWNFPLAIFLGQITAALAAGNSVIAKPAEQTPLIASHALGLLHRAGIPNDVLQLLPGDGAIGARLVADPDIAGVLFTGATDTAKAIQRSLAKKAGPIVPMIAETGGQNAMIIDSSALAEQVVADAIQSAFNSAGQRCSALRVLFIQDDVASRTLEMLRGAMAELTIGDPAMLSTDVGPVIDEDAQIALQKHVTFLSANGTLIYRCELSAATDRGTYFPPHMFEIESLSLLDNEVFGPILHVIRFAANKLDNVIEAINATGYGLTLGIHSRIEETIEYITRRVRVGNVYVNRNMIGAVVGVQPFGGEGLSGTGPKAGGPNYLRHLCTERTVSINIAAVGGNPDLLSMIE